MGFSKRETVKHLTQKFGITEQGAYYHFQTLNSWVDQYLDFKNKAEFQFNILNQLNSINREASFQFMHTADPKAKIGFLRVRLAALSKLAEFSGFSKESNTELIDNKESRPDIFADLNKYYTAEEKAVLLKAEEALHNALTRRNSDTNERKIH